MIKPVISPEDAMHYNRNCRCLIFGFVFTVLFGASTPFAGVSRSIQEQYRREYENKAMFLKIPIHLEKQLVYVSPQGIRVDPSIGPPRFKVGDQLRILLIDFSGDEIRFRMNGISNPGPVEIIYKFDAGLQEDFPNRDAFEKAIQSTFTEGLKYTEIEDAKRSFVEDQFEQSVKEIAGAASISREAVLKSIAPQVPAYRDAQRDIDNLKSKLQDVSGQLSQSQAENRKLESETKSQQAELSRLKNANAALQSKMDDSASQISKLGDELRDAKGNAQGYQKEIANLQRSLNIRVDTGRDLASQIADLAQAMRKLQKDSDALTAQVNTLRSNLDAQQAANARLLGDNEELKSQNSRMQSTINTLTSKEDSLARQYLTLKQQKEKLEEFSRTLAAIRTRIEEDKTEDGFHTGKANIYVKSVLLGSLTWKVPVRLNHGKTQSSEAVFTAESIDYIRLTPEERGTIRMLGNKLRTRVELTSASASMEVTPESGKADRQIGERDSASWRWNIINNGTQDSRLILTARLINNNSLEIPVFQQEKAVLSSNAVRQLRSLLQPVPLVAGILLGFLLFGIVGIFRRPGKRNAAQRPSATQAPPDPPAYIGRKKL
jgi:predicted nuclease with TOPRIM domain